MRIKHQSVQSRCASIFQGRRSAKGCRCVWNHHSFSDSIHMCSLGTPRGAFSGVVPATRVVTGSRELKAATLLFRKEALRVLARHASKVAAMQEVFQAWSEKLGKVTGHQKGGAPRPHMHRMCGDPSCSIQYGSDHSVAWSKCRVLTPALAEAQMVCQA